MICGSRAEVSWFSLEMKTCSAEQVEDDGFEDQTGFTRQNTFIWWPSHQPSCLCLAAGSPYWSRSWRWWNPHSFDTDEGINLGKGALVAAGFHPYADIWSDQPPILTYVLAAVQWLLPRTLVPPG